MHLWIRPKLLFQLRVMGCDSPKPSFHLVPYLKLTYMSIKLRLAVLEASGDLTRYAPKLRAPLKRRLFLAKEAVDEFNNPSSATNLLCGRGYIANAMTRWVSGGLVHGNRKRGLFLDRLDPPPNEVWEVRVTEPAIQARLFGRFAEQDTLILNRFHTRQFLGDKGSVNWSSAM